MGLYLFGASYKPGPVLGTEDAAVNRKDQEPALQALEGTARQPAVVGAKKVGPGRGLM